MDLSIRDDAYAKQGVGKISSGDIVQSQGHIVGKVTAVSQDGNTYFVFIKGRSGKEFCLEVRTLDMQQSVTVRKTGRSSAPGDTAPSVSVKFTDVKGDLTEVQHRAKYRIQYLLATGSFEKAGYGKLTADTPIDEQVRILDQIQADLVELLAQGALSKESMDLIRAQLSKPPLNNGYRGDHDHERVQAGLVKS